VKAVLVIAVGVLVVGTLGACEPDYDGTAFLCDATHGCPSGQMCFGGRCRRKDGAVVVCAGTTCAPNQMCCVDFFNGARCLDASDTCGGDQALCDDIADCATGERCCDGKTTACAQVCESEIACTTTADCPGDMPNCCAQPINPWKVCNSLPCD
jgi:hypothetical protein